MGQVLTIKREKPAKKASLRNYSYYLEDPRAQFLFTDTDERGKPAFFFQMNITGLRNRVFGPYESRAMAIDGFDTVLAGALDAFCNVHNAGRGKSNNGMECIAAPEHLTPVPVR